MQTIKLLFTLKCAYTSSSDHADWLVKVVWMWLKLIKLHVAIARNVRFARFFPPPQISCRNQEIFPQDVKF